MLIAEPLPKILFMGNVFTRKWGVLREAASELLAASIPFLEETKRPIEVLVPYRGICPVASPEIYEVVLPQFRYSWFLWEHDAVTYYGNKNSRRTVLYNMDSVLPERLKIPGVVGLNNLMAFPQPEKYNWREYERMEAMYRRFFTRRSVRRAQRIHTHTHFTERDAKDLFADVPTEKYRTIHFGINPEQWAPGNWSQTDHDSWKLLEDHGVTGKYVFYSGSLSMRRNLTVLVNAFRQFHERHPDYKLVLAGGHTGTNPDPKFEKALAGLPPESVTRLALVQPRALALLYQKAEFFVFPSQYDGFPLSVLEAQASGCPVIASNATSLPEVLGESAKLFFPTAEDELLKHMELLSNETERQKVIAAGWENIKRFTWEKAAKSWLELMDDAYRIGNKSA